MSIRSMAKMVMPDLIERVKCVLANPGDTPWLPELTDDLVASGWQGLYEKCGLSPSTYSTSRVIARDVEAPCNVVAVLSTSFDTQDVNKRIKIENLDESLARQYNDADIQFYEEEEMRSSNILQCVKDALYLLDRAPNLASTVTTLVRSLHLIKPKDDDYDISFSEPQIPFSIFVSVPQKDDPINILRVAEVVVHEAMHLQLTLVEHIVALVDSTKADYYSPWRKEYRNAQGILHALYVFRVINRFLETFSNDCSGDIVQHASRRQDEIIGQIREIQQFHCCADLTTVGKTFVLNLL